MMTFPGWCPFPDTLLKALMECFQWGNSGVADRATGWLYEAGGDHPPGRVPVDWPQPLAKLGPAMMLAVTALLRAPFACCCFQAYRNGTGCGWHDDGSWGAQAIISLGTTRTFEAKWDGLDYTTKVSHGDLLYMSEPQMHRVPPELVTGVRCSLIFRSAR